MPTATKKIIRAYPYQWQTLGSTARFIAMCGGTGGGKTWWSPIWLRNLIAKDVDKGVAKGARYLALAPTSEMMRDMVVPMIIEHYKGTYLQGRYYKQSRTYHLPTGGKIYCRSADKPERIEGHHFRGVIVDEPSQMKAYIWPILQARTGYYKAPILFTGYPTNMGWYYSDIYKPWEAGDPDYEMIEFSSIDNPDYPVEEYERAKETLPSWLFDMRYDGKFRKPFGLVYPEFGTDMYVDPFEIPSDWPSFISLDPGVFYGALFTAWHDGTYYTYDEYYTEIVASGEEHAKSMLDKVRGTCEGWIYDPARLTDIGNLIPHGCGPFYKANNAVQPGIETVTGQIKGGTWKILRGTCPNLIDQMEKYSYPTDPVTGDIAKAKPIKKYDHLPDCARYLFHTVDSEPLETEGVLVYDGTDAISPY